jgi:hypothetical protein
MKDVSNIDKKRRSGRTTGVSSPTAASRPGFVSLCSRGGSGLSAPIMFSSNRVGDAILSTGIGQAAGRAVAGFASVLPVGLAGIEVRETLHRFDANAHLPTLERGISAANRIGEPLATLSMRWRLAPDGFEATPGLAPPDTEIRDGLSQRFVMQDGTITFQERGSSAIRFFGAGRTFPATTDGQPRLLFAGTAVILEGVGSLKGIRGTLLISGEVAAPASMAMSIVGRFDAGGPVGTVDALGPLTDLTGTVVPATVLTAVGDGDEGGVELLRVVRVGNDMLNTGGLRSFFRKGVAIGSARGSLSLDDADLRCAVPLRDATRVLVFTDAAGRQIGTITAENLEGTSSSEHQDGHILRRLAGYGTAVKGTGALTGAGGVLTFETAADASGRSSTLYSLRLADPAGRFRSSYSDAFRVAPRMAPDGPPPPAPVETLHFVDNGRPITDTDRAILRYADRTLADGMELVRWWEEKDRANNYAERFDVVREFNASDRSFGFFDTAVIADAGLPVMGIVQEMFYDRQKVATGELIRDQMKEFVLKYFMRVSHLRQPEAVAAGDPVPLTMFQRMFSWLPDAGERRVGFGYQQLYYKLRDSGRIGKFAPEEQSTIVDLREIGTKYDWILLKVDIFDFNLSFAPFGSDALKVQMPLKEQTYLVLGPPFVTNEDDPEPDVLGRYGFGYAFVPYAPPEGPSVVAYGPGHFAAAIQTVDFTVMKNGEIRVRAAFVVNRPSKITNLDIDPIDWGFQLADRMTFGTASRVMSPMKALADRLPLRVSGVDPISTYIWLANTMTGGMASRRFGHSKTVLEKRMLVQHFMQHYEMLSSSLLVWRAIPDWTHPESVSTFSREETV